MNIKRNVKFDLHSRKDAIELPIRMRIQYAGIRIDFPLGYRINPDLWINEIASGSEKNTINKLVIEYRSYVNEIFARFELIEKRIPEKFEVVEMFNVLSGKQQPRIPNEEFFKTLTRFMIETSLNRAWSDATIKAYSNLKRLLLIHDKTVSFNSINESFMIGFLGFLREPKTYKENGKTKLKIGYKNWSIRGYLDNLFSFLRWSTKEGFYKLNAHIGFKPNLKGLGLHDVIHLSWEELMILKDYKFTAKQLQLEKVRDIFIFRSFTGMRYSDAAKLKRSDVKDKFISIVTLKTLDPIRINLNKYAQAILDKYKDFHFKNDLALPKMGLSDSNIYIKEIGQLCKFNDPTTKVYFKGPERIENVFPKWAVLSSHCARKTFVVNSLSLDIPIDVIMSFTGHKSYRSIAPYKKVINKLKVSAMEKFNNM